MLADKETASAEVMWWAIALILLVLGMGVAILLVRHRSMRKRGEDEAQIVYSLHDLRRMLKAGEITQEEFEKLKEIVNTQTRKTGPLSR